MVVTVDLQNSVKFNRIEFYTSHGKELQDYQIQCWTSTSSKCAYLPFAYKRKQDTNAKEAPVRT